MAYIEQLSPYHYRVKPGFVPGMAVPGVFYVNDRLKGLLFEELQAGPPPWAHLHRCIPCGLHVGGAGALGRRERWL